VGALETGGAYSDSYLEGLLALGRDVEAVAQAKYQHDAKARFNSLLKIYRRLMEQARSAPGSSLLGGIAKDLSDIALEIERDSDRATALGAFGVALPSTDPGTGNRYLRTAEELLERAQSGRVHGFRDLAKLLADARDPRAGQFIRRAALAAGKDRTFLQVVAESFVHPGLADEVAWFVDLVRGVDVDDRDYLMRWACSGLISLRRFDQAEGIVAAITDGGERAHAAANLAEAIGDADAKRARRILREAAPVVAAGKNGMHKADQFGEIAAALARLSDPAADELFAAGEKAARDSEMHPYNRKSTLSKLAARLVDGGRFERAQDIAASIGDPSIRLQMDWFLVNSYTAAGRYDDAAKIARDNPHTADRDSGLALVASALAAKREFDRAEKVIASIGEVLSTKARAIGDLALGLIADGQLDRAIAMARGMPSGATQAELLALLAAKLGSGGDSRADELLVEAVAAAHELQMKEARRERDEAAAALSAALVCLKQLHVAEQVARHIGNDQQKAWALATVAARLKGQAPKRAGRLFDEAEELSENAPVSPRRLQFLRDVSVMSSSDLVDRNLRKMGSRRSEALATRLLEAGEYDRVGKIAENIWEDHRKADILNQLAGALAKARDRRAARAIALAREAAAASEYQPEKLLTELAVLLVPTRPKLASAILHEAEESAGDQRRHVEILCDFAEAYLPRDRAPARALCERALTIARKAPEEDRVELLVRVAAAFDRLGSHARADKIINALREAEKKATAWAASAAVRAETSFLTRAEEAARRIPAQYPAQRAGALVSVASGLAETNDARATEVFAEAGKIAGRISDPEIRSYALRDVAEGLTKAGRLEEAAKMAGGIPSGATKSAALSELAEAYAANGNLKEAFVTLAMRSIASADEDDRPLDDFIRVIAGWTPHLERANHGWTLSMLSEVTEVAGWHRPDWSMIHKLLPQSRRFATGSPARAESARGVRGGSLS
jgi:hypothetical protein